MAATFTNEDRMFVNQDNPTPARAAGGKQAKQRRTIAWLLAALGLLVLIGVSPARAAIALNYFTVSVTGKSVTLQWSTAGEYNISGFEVLCKEVDEPEEAYHRIGFRQAEGTANQGATYFWPVTSGLAQGQAYCFRLREITTDGMPGDVYDRCGYGLLITPTPTPLFGVTTGTPNPFEIAASLAPTATLILPPTLTPQPTVDPLSIPTAPAAPVSALPTPTEIFVSPLGAPVEPFPTPTPFGGFESPLVDASGAQVVDPALQPPPVDSFAPPTVDPFLAPTPDPFALPTEMPTPTFTPFADSPLALAEGAVDPITGAPVDGSAGVAPPEPTPTPAYIVITAEPTVDAAAALLPTFTPFPSATPQAGQALVSLPAATTDNLMLMMLCFTFVGAGGFGILGLITVILFMRSRSDRELTHALWRLDQRRRF